MAIPANAQIVGVKINEIEKREEQILNHKVQPVQRTIPVGFTNNQEEFIGISDYENISVYPQQPVEVVDNGYLRGIQIVTVAVYPCQYHVNNDKLEVYQSLDWSLEYELYETTGEKKSQIWNDSFLNALKAIVSNPQDVLTLFSTREQLRTASVNALNVHSQYIIVTSAELASSFNEFMAWKKRKGISIDLVTIEDIKNAYTGDLISGINDDAGKLRQFLSDAYQNGCEYVLLGGDINILPIRYAYYNYQFGGLNESQKNIPTDLYFSDFDGNWDSDKDGIYGEINDNIDFYPEIYIGRILVNSPVQIQTWIKKVLLYEQNPGKGDFNYLTKAFFTQADQLLQGNEANIVLNRATWIPSANRVVFNEEGGSNTGSVPAFPTGKAVIDEFNNHYGICSFMGHGGPTNVAVATKGINGQPKYKVTSLDNGYAGMEGADVSEQGNGFDNMTNVDYPSVYYSISCETTPFDRYGNNTDTPNMGQTFTSEINGGGPLYLGNTRVGFVSSSSDFFKEFMKVLPNNCNVGVAQAISKNKYSNTGVYAYLKLSHNIIGCPEIPIWTAVPSVFSNVSITENGNNVTIDSHVSNSTICLISALDNGESYYEVRKNTSASTFSNVSKPYLVTITKQNYIPYMKDPDNIFIQNETIVAEKYIQGIHIKAGEKVTLLQSEGPVILKEGADVILNASESVNLEGGFKVEKGGMLKAY